MSRLKALRTAKGFTQQKVATLTGIDQSNYSKMERGLIQPTYEQYILLAKLFDTSMDYIAGLTDEPNPHPRSAKEIPPFLL